MNLDSSKNLVTCQFLPFAVGFLRLPLSFLQYVQIGSIHMNMVIGHSFPTRIFSEKS